MVDKHKIVLAYNIYSPPNASPFRTIMSIVYSGYNIHLANTASNTIPLKRNKQTIAYRLTDGRTVDSKYVATLPLTILSDEASKVHIFS